MRRAWLGIVLIAGIGSGSAQIAPGPPQPTQQPGTTQQQAGDPTAPNVVPGAPPAFVPGTSSGGDALSTAPRVVRMSGSVTAKNLVSRVNPVYPAEAKAEHLEGTVILGARIGKRGHVESVAVVSGPRPLQAAAVDAVKQWVYRPYFLNGEPVPVETTVAVHFNLQ